MKVLSILYNINTRRHLIKLDFEYKNRYNNCVMKAGIHPKFMKTKVTCAGCGTTFETMSTVPELHVEICSACHPFYTGKQKLVDSAGRVDRFRARTAAAQKIRGKKSGNDTAQKLSATPASSDKTIANIDAEFEQSTVKTPAQPKSSTNQPTDNDHQ